MIKTKLKIRTYGDPCLRKKSDSVKKVGLAERMLIEAMMNTIKDNETEIGLAAPQVGINKQIFIVDIPDFPRIFVDPKITGLEGQEIMEEGCLSFSGISFNVKRPKKIVVEYLNEDNKKCRLRCEDFFARVILHETDHLNGKLIVDHASQDEKKRKKQALEELLKKTKQELKIKF